SWRRTLRLSAATAIAVGLLTAGPRPVAASSPPRMPAIPPTVSRTMPVSLLVAAGEARTGAPPGAVLRTHGAVTTRAQTLCPGFQVTAVGLVWHHVGGGSVRSSIRT